MTRLARLMLTAALALTSIALSPAPVPTDPPPAPRRVRTPTSVILKRLGGEPCPDGSEFTCVAPTVPPTLRMAMNGERP